VINPTVPLLTIITPVFNGEKFISQCLQSVIDQNCRDIEHIVVDGNSTDRTAAIVQEFASTHSHLRLISEPDRGQSDAQNKGIRAARAGYISILNVDDFYAPGALSRIVEIIPTLREPRFIYGNCNVLKEGDELRSVNRPSVLKIENILVDRWTWEYPYNPTAYFYPKAIHESVGYYDVKEHFAMDLKFILAAIQEIEPLHIDEILGNFRLTPGTKTFQSIKNGSLEPRVRAIFRDAFIRAPWQTKIGIVSFWISNKPRVVYWNCRRRLRQMARTRET